MIPFVDSMLPLENCMLPLDNSMLEFLVPVVLRELEALRTSWPPALNALKIGRMRATRIHFGGREIPLSLWTRRTMHANSTWNAARTIDDIIYSPSSGGVFDVGCVSAMSNWNNVNESSMCSRIRGFSTSLDGYSTEM